MLAPILDFRKRLPLPGHDSGIYARAIRCGSQGSNEKPTGHSTGAGIAPPSPAVDGRSAHATAIKNHYAKRHAKAPGRRAFLRVPKISKSPPRSDPRDCAASYPATGKPADTWGQSPTLTSLASGCRAPSILLNLLTSSYEIHPTPLPLGLQKTRRSRTNRQSRPSANAGTVAKLTLSL